MTTDNILFISRHPRADEMAMTTYSVEELMQLESRISSISARIVKTPADLLDEEITHSLKIICQAIRLPRGGLINIPEGNPILTVSHAWYDEGVEEVSSTINLAELFPWSYNHQVLNGKIIALTSVDSLPPEAATDRLSFMQLGVKSSLTIPLFTNTRIHHLIAVHSLEEEIIWQKAFINRLRLIGEIFVSALHQREVVFSLQTSEKRLDIAAASAGTGLWELDLASKSFWASNKARELFDFSPDEQITLTTFVDKIHPDDQSRVLLAIDQARHSGREINIEYRTLGADGTIRWMASRGQLQQEPGDERTSIMGATLDITRRKILEEKAQEHIQEIDSLRKQLELENTLLREESGLERDHKSELGISQCMQEVMRQIELVANTSSTVLIQGETGTGKELIAQTIHQLSGYRDRVMVTVNCAALPAALVESELFGRERGAFTGAVNKQMGRFELANNSTLFLDEIAEMPLETQAKLLRVLQDGKFERLGSPYSIQVNTRIIAATNRNLLQEVENGRFRRDLFYRLNIFPIHVPPLRERQEDIPQLIWKFVNEYNQQIGKRINRITRDDMERLTCYAWPGNIRELRNVIEHALIVSTGDVLELSLSRLPSSTPQQAATLPLRELERQHIATTLQSTQGKIKGKGGAAELLGINPSTLYSRMRKLNIAPTHT